MSHFEKNETWRAKLLLSRKQSLGEKQTGVLLLYINGYTQRANPLFCVANGMVSALYRVELNDYKYAQNNLVIRAFT